MFRKGCCCFFCFIDSINDEYNKQNLCNKNESSEYIIYETK